MKVTTHPAMLYRKAARGATIIVAAVASCSVFGACGSFSDMREALAENDVVPILKRITRAQEAYFAETSGYDTFEQLVAHGYLDPVFKVDRPVMKGYVFTISIPRKHGDGENIEPSYSVNADPRSRSLLHG